MIKSIQWRLLHQLLLTGIGMAAALPVAATQEVLKPANGAGTPDTLTITWTMDTDNSSSAVILAQSDCDLRVGREITLPSVACRHFFPDGTESRVKSVGILYNDLVTPASPVRWTVVELQLTDAQRGKHRVVSVLGNGSSYLMATPSNFKLKEYGERAVFSWNANVPNADSYLVEACCSTDGSRVAELVSGDAVSMPLPEALRAGCSHPARGVKVTVRACRNGGCGSAAKLDVCSPERLLVRRAVGLSPGDFEFAWTPVAGADSYKLEICCDVNKLTMTHLIQTNTHAEGNQFKMHETGNPYVMKVEERFNKLGCNLSSGAIGLGTGFKASVRPCTNGVCGESKTETFCERFRPLSGALPNP